ncbi:poly(ADP-ribose) glycohydrolase ARH3-like [Tropilaelaps mercedesae]|uniref:ADP-ribosylhydrolase ARH3 n=1 Tax=Tropilaelaps mercedesae TaxID=418985 RepID=A0A1V9X8H7_9ACAR|nr:poly(ADP-ribose) glycohydrolase ARH3-like [Tropilaelaps mercedesae]
MSATKAMSLDRFKVHSAHRQSLITHTNGLGILGAVLQAAAVHLALRAEGSIEVKNFINELKEILRKVEGVENGHKMSIDMEQFLRDLGNDISAHGAVPTAVYAFLKALQPLSEFKTSSGVVRTIFTAIRLGGDTDTISSMAASIAGKGFSCVYNVVV